MAWWERNGDNLPASRAMERSEMKRRRQGSGNQGARVVLVDGSQLGDWEPFAPRPGPFFGGCR
jgi:hypothetical protein